MRVLQLVVHLPGGKVEELQIDGEQVLIGSGAHCDVRLPMDQAQTEHIVLDVTPAGLFAQARSFEPSPTLSGVPFTETPLGETATLGVGQTRIEVSFVESETAATAAQRKKKKGGFSMVTWVAIGLAIPLMGVMLALPPAEEASAGRGKPPPDLFSEPAAKCPKTNPEQALAFAEERLAVAESRRERRAFKVQDGVAAVPLFETAKVCFELGGDAERAGYARDAAKALREEMTVEYRTRQLRLEHLLENGDLGTVQREVELLLAFTEGKGGEYVQWLQTLDRKLRVQAGQGGNR